MANSIFKSHGITDCEIIEIPRITNVEDIF